MSQWVTIDLKCTSCETYIYDLVMPRIEMAQLPACVMCTSPMVRVLSVPKPFRRALLDGNNRFRDLKEAARLEVDSMDMPPEKREGIQKEINKLKEVKK